ncbi:hypothetical protein SAMN06296036_109124 [Pseudobacteriovorax antillogorgiicola]|uniref:WD40-like Beta Propeller Repeat n=2 Tax=Pseudobacteriovorax antillogorgiicola TaxID=1513793 RepID=A0A1Y6BUV4_9BACT|nr:hypothetical protein EDD56_10989 [Pseudobacteriovorax antillogorgiicola]SMF29679.1 hypothetical protein SAMN06296036_109124 [Pseudobacteriovorax antillogorgiicola]
MSILKNLGWIFKALTFLAVVGLWPKVADSLAATKHIKKTPFLRFSGSVHKPKINRQNNLLAFTSRDGFGITVVDLKTRDVMRVTLQKVSYSYFWAPNGFRLFYREMYEIEDKVMSEVKAFDVPLRKSITIEKIPGPSGALSFDPRDFRFYLYHSEGIMRHQIQYPGERLAEWQMAMKSKDGYWLVTNSSVLWVTHNGITMRKVNDSPHKLDSFDISPDGNSILWADIHEQIFLSDKGQSPRMIARGLDPKWHPDGEHILYAHAQILADKIIDHDIRMIDRHGVGRFLTRTLSTDERYPVWLDKSSTVLYTHFAGTDIYEVSFKL